MPQIAKNRSEMSTAEMIVDSGWWTEGEPAWLALPLAERERVALERTRCKFAYPTWERPVNCVHLKCRIARGELPKIAETNCVLRSETQSGWLRFIDDRQQLARITGPIANLPAKPVSTIPGTLAGPAWYFRP